MMAAKRVSGVWERYAWAAGIIFVIALVAETVISTAVGVNQNDPAAKIANALHQHRERELVIVYLSVVYAATFSIYLSRLSDVLRRGTARPS